MPLGAAPGERMITSLPVARAQRQQRPLFEGLSSAPAIWPQPVPALRARLR
jgi:hypothetical protein